MFQLTPSPILPPPGGDAVRNFTLASRSQRQLARLHLKDLPPEAKLRLKWFDWHQDHGQNVSLTCRHFAISRQTFYRWQKRFRPHDLTTLQDRPSTPHKRRQRSWTTTQVLAVQRLRETYRWGKDKLRVLLQRQGISLSASSIGRILSSLKRTARLREPLRHSQTRRRQWKRQYATRKPKTYQPELPGDIVQLDTMDIRPEPGITLKQFTAVDVVSRWSVPTVASNATATLAVKALDAILDRMPFAVRAIQVDGGSEFMAEFEQHCQARGLLLFELPPRSPKLNGRVERANRTYREEFYDCSTAPPTVSGFKADLRTFEHTYNCVRPHQSLGFLTPAEYLTSHHPDIVRMEVLSRTS